MRCVLQVLLIALVASPAAADRLKEEMSWNDVTSKGCSLVLGRLEGGFDGPGFHNRRLELRRVETGKRIDVEVDQGLGYFEALVPPGIYEFLAIQATYYPPGRPLNPTRYRPVRQRFGVHPRRGEAKAGPRIRVPGDRPVYVGTVRIENRSDGLVYRGHYIRVVDEYAEALARLERDFHKLTASLSQADITPRRDYLLRPQRPESALSVVDVGDPIQRAREYVSEGKFRQAMNWLQTFMPTSDEERNAAQLLIGEALLGDGQFPEAIGKLGDALVADPENLRALRLLARAHIYNEDMEDALNLYQALAEALPGDAEANLRLGYLYALQSEKERSDQAFDSAFQYDCDYLLHDIAPFVSALKAVRQHSLEYVPPRLLRQRVRPPRSIESRRASRNQGLALIIDHKGKVVAARVAPGSNGSFSAMMLSLIRTTFKPASLNGVPVPSLLFMDGATLSQGGSK